MTIYNLNNKREVSEIANDTLALLDYQSAKAMGYDTNLSPISHHTHDLKLHFMNRSHHSHCITMWLPSF